jgi:hypothetical protein
MIYLYPDNYPPCLFSCVWVYECFCDDGVFLDVRGMHAVEYTSRELLFDAFLIVPEHDASRQNSLELIHTCINRAA